MWNTCKIASWGRICEYEANRWCISQYLIVAFSGISRRWVENLDVNYFDWISIRNIWNFISVFFFITNQPTDWSDQIFVCLISIYFPSTACCIHVYLPVMHTQSMDWKVKKNSKIFANDFCLRLCNGSMTTTHFFSFFDISLYFAKLLASAHFCEQFFFMILLLCQFSFVCCSAMHIAWVCTWCLCQNRNSKVDAVVTRMRQILVVTVIRSMDFSCV